MDPRDLSHVVARYDGEILFTDQHLGSVVDALERNGLSGDTLLVITSDHGEEFFEHGNKGHGQTLMDETLMVPLIVRFPGRIAPGLRIREQVRQLDIAPTLLSFAGLTGELPAGPRRSPDEGGSDSIARRRIHSAALWRLALVPSAWFQVPGPSERVDGDGIPL
jgi:arylsulfatase A-like enzyme